LRLIATDIKAMGKSKTNSSGTAETNSSSSLAALTTRAGHHQQRQHLPSLRLIVTNAGRGVHGSIKGQFDSRLPPAFK
jgi:hypothetical protein